MAKTGSNSRSFLRSSLFDYAELRYDKNGDPVEEGFFKTLLSKNRYGLVLPKKTILESTLSHGVEYRMVFNAMHMRSYSKEDIKEVLRDIKEELENIGIAGIVEFHAADTTQNSDHIHLWINSEEKYVYQKIAHYLVENNLTPKESVHIQKFETNGEIDKAYLFNNEEHEENYATPEEAEAITADYIQAQEIKKDFKESETSDGKYVSIDDIKSIQRGTQRSGRDNSHMLSRLSDFSMATNWGWEDTSDSMLVPFNAFDDVSDRQKSDYALRPESQGASTSSRLTELKDRFKNLLEKISKKEKTMESNISKGRLIVKGSNATDLFDRISENSEKIEALYNKIYGNSDTVAGDFNKSSEEWKKIQTSRGYQRKIMRQR